MIEVLLDKAQVNLQDHTGHSALYVAVREGHYTVAELLLKNKVRVDLQTNKGSTSSIGLTEVIKLLLKYHAKVDLKNKENKSALDLAEKENHSEVIKLLQGWLTLLCEYFIDDTMIFPFL